MLTIKRIFVVLLVLALSFGVYAGAGEIVFQFGKTEYIAAAKQYAADLVFADNITQADCRKGTDWILVNQRSKRKALFRKYSSRTEPDMTLDYLKELKERMRSGWKWHDEKIEDIQTVSVQKDFFSGYVYVTLQYATTVVCDSGGAVFYEDGIASVGLENEHSGAMRTFSRVEIAVSYDGKSEIGIISRKEPNSDHLQKCAVFQ